MQKPNLAVEICGIELKNPIIAASGTFGFGLDFSQYIDLEKIGAITMTGITLEPRDGNPPPRIAETPSGILNSVGLQNPGVNYFLDVVLPDQFGFYGATKKTTGYHTYLANSRFRKVFCCY